MVDDLERAEMGWEARWRELRERRAALAEAFPSLPQTVINPLAWARKDAAWVGAAVREDLLRLRGIGPIKAGQILRAVAAREAGRAARQDYVRISIHPDGAAVVLDGYDVLRAMAESGGGRVPSRFHFDTSDPAAPVCDGWIELGQLREERPAQEE